VSAKKHSETEIQILDKGGEQLWTTSLDLAEKFGKRHDNILQSIREMECSGAFRLLNFQESDYLDIRGKTQPLFMITRDGFTLLAMGFTGKKAIHWKERYIAAFNAMEKKILADGRAAARQGRMEWQKARLEGKTGFKVMNEALRLVREEQGKLAQSHHYSNEARLINWAASGKFSKLDRDSLTTPELDLLAKLEVKNSVLISRSLGYRERKAILEQYAIDLRPTAPLLE
jgi:Rha family phage regulatory protein